MSKRIEISHRTIIFTFVFMGVVWLVLQAWDIILLVFVSIIIMSALKPAVDFLERIRLPRALSIVIMYLIGWIIFGVAIAVIIPPLVDQTRRLVNLLPPALENLQYLNSHQQEITNQLLSGIGTLPENIFKIVVSVFGNLINLLTTMVVSFYLLLERRYLDKRLSSLFGGKYSSQISLLIGEIESKLGGWIRAELVLMTAIGAATYLGLRILGLETALPLAILAGMLEIIPGIGPLVSVIPAVIIAFLVHPFLALSTAALYFLIQFLENNILVPVVMRKAAGVDPLVSLLGIMLGFRLAGTAGAILAIPAVLVIHTIGRHYFSFFAPKDTPDLNS